MLRLTLEREARGWTKAELARRARLNASTVGLIEAGRFRPYGVQTIRIARALGLNEADAARLLDDAAEEATPS